VCSACVLETLVCCVQCLCVRNVSLLPVLILS